MINTLKAFFHVLDMDASDAHYYPGILLVAIAAGIAYFPAGLAILGLGLIYPAVRRPSGPPQPPDQRRQP